jgi:uncharacterized protein (DUF488 family)
MYYRRKVLLALVEAFGGRLGRTDFLKLLFTFCDKTQKNYYDFFPYKYGGFSFLAYQDKERLTDLGFLRNGNNLQLCTDQSFLTQLNPEDQQVLRSMSVGLRNLRGKALIRQVYLEHSHFACRSEVLTSVLSQEEADKVGCWWNKDLSEAIFTIGYEGMTIDAYLNKLISNNIKALLDVRRNPNSMKYGFSKTRLRYYVEKTGIKYYHIPHLGIPSDLRQNLEKPEDYYLLLEYYRSEILPKQTSAIEEVKALLRKNTRVALTCFERDYRLCHRHKITQYLADTSDLNIKVVHL